MNRHLKKLAAFFALAALWFCAGANAAEVRAWLDRSTMQMGETVTLNVQISGNTSAAQPDFSALASDFDLLGTQSSTSVNMVNGQTTSKLLWAVALQPKHAGTLTIPALNVDGQSTQPISLMVQAASAGSGGKAGDDVYIETTVEPHSPYVQQQVRLTVKLFYAVNLIDGGLDDPQAKGVVVRKLGQDANYRAQVGGREYRVVERHYALLPETSGTVTLPPIAFRGHAMNPNDANSFFSRGRSVAAHSDPLALDVRARPAGSGTDTWLPARSVTLTAGGVDASTPARVGDPFTLTLHLKAQGLGFEQLPELKLPPIDGADIYPDKPTTQNRDDGQWLYGERERKFAIVPNRAGTLTMPVISVSWWDTAHDQEQTAQVPAVTMHVAAAAGSASTPVAPPINSTSTTVAATPTVAPSTIALAGADSSELVLWRTLAFLALVLWAATVFAWILWLLAQRWRERATQPQVEAAIDTRRARAAFRAACTRGDCHAIARTLLAWARLTQPRLRNLSELAHALDEPVQAEAIGRLERECYGNATPAALSGDISSIFRNGLKFKTSPGGNSKPSALPVLYPFDIGSPSLQVLHSPSQPKIMLPAD